MTTTAFAQTTQDAKNLILADLWIQERENPDFAEFMAYNDIGLPLAYLLHNDLCKPSKMSQMFIDECFELLLAGLDIEDKGFSRLSQLLDAEESKVISLMHDK